MQSMRSLLGSMLSVQLAMMQRPSGSMPGVLLAMDMWLESSRGGGQSITGTPMMVAIPRYLQPTHAPCLIL